MRIEALDLEAMQQRCARMQWSLQQIDFEGPGRELLPEAERAGACAFLTELVWVEHAGRALFLNLAAGEEPTVKAIYNHCAEDEARHAQAQARLLQRWGGLQANMPRRGFRPQLIIDCLEKLGTSVHPSVYATLITLVEVVLDGACVRHVAQSILDPVSRQTYALINADEARHLAMDWYALERYGREMSWLASVFAAAGAMARPRFAATILLGFLPFMRRIAERALAMGLAERRLQQMFGVFVAQGDARPTVRGLHSYRLARRYAAHIADGNLPPGELLLRLSDAVDGLRPEH
jgi:hypothetical protein